MLQNPVVGCVLNRKSYVVQTLGGRFSTQKARRLRASKKRISRWSRRKRAEWSADRLIESKPNTTSSHQQWASMVCIACIGQKYSDMDNPTQQQVWSIGAQRIIPTRRFSPRKVWHLIQWLKMSCSPLFSPGFYPIFKYTNRSRLCITFYPHIKFVGYNIMLYYTPWILCITIISQ